MIGGRNEFYNGGLDLDVLPTTWLKLCFTSYVIMQRWNAGFAQFLKNIEIRKRIYTRCDFIAAIFIFSHCN